MKEKYEKYIIKSSEKIFKVLELIIQNEKGLSLTQISKILGFQKTTTFRYLNTLLKFGYIELENGFYKPSLKFFGRRQIITTIERNIRNLVEKVDETVLFGIISGKSVIYLLREEPEKEIIARKKILFPYKAEEEALGILLMKLQEGDIDVKRMGYYIKRDELIVEISVPINQTKVNLGGISIILPHFRISESKTEAFFISNLLEIQKKISEEIN